MHKNFELKKAQKNDSAFVMLETLRVNSLRKTESQFADMRAFLFH